MDLGIKQKTALVMGGGGGLGSAIARSLATEGANVVVADVNLDAANATAEAIKAEGFNAVALAWDLRALDTFDANVGWIEANVGSVDILVNNTGGPPPTPSSGQEADLWREHFEGMVLSVIKLTDRVLPGMRERRWGRIITSTSSGVIAPIPNLGISNALRMSLVGWSKTLAREVGKDGITANIILPGRIATSRITYLDEMRAKREGRSVEEVSRESTGAIALGRYGDPSEYGDAVAFLASTRASYITGSTIRVDGGLLSNI